MALSKSSRAKSFWADAHDTSLKVAYTCPANCTAEVVYLHVINVSGNNTIHVRWYIAADNYTSQFLNGYNMSSGEYFDFPDLRLFLQAGDQITFQSDNVGHADMIGSVIETFIPVG
jgi:hypothetical protein